MSSATSLLKSVLASLLLLAVTVHAAPAQDYPAKPIRLIIPFPPGGSNDTVGRLIATGRGHAIAMKCPAEVYTPSKRPYQGLPDLEYPFHDRDVLVTACGRICIYRKKINVLAEPLPWPKSNTYAGPPA